MSSLGAKVKEILHSSDSKDAARGEVDSNTPGSFPADTTTTGHEHTKQHKPNEPRGHSHSDSGVGFTDSDVTHRETTSHDTTKPLERIPEPTTVDRRPEESTNVSSQQHDTSLPSQQASRPVDSTNLPTAEAAGGPGAASTKEHPYWGDLPVGQGVYNTVAGHGSAEDAERHRGAHGAAQETLPSSTSSHLGSGAQSHLYGTNPSSTQPGSVNPEERTFGPGFNEGLAGAAAASAAGAGAYGLSKDRGTDDSAAPSKASNDPATAAARTAFASQGTDHYGSQRDTTFPGGTGTYPAQHGTTAEPHSSQRLTQNPDESNTGSRFHEGLAGAAAGAAGAGAYEHHKHRKAEETPETVEEPQGSKGRSFPLIHRSHKEKEVKHEKEPKEKSGGLFHRSKEDEVKPEKELSEKSGGLFHRSHKEEVEPQMQEDKHHGSKTAAALGAGVGGAATYAATRGRDSDRDRDATSTSRYQETTAPQSTGQQVGTGYGTQPSGTGYGSGQAYGNNPQGALSRDPAAQTYQQEASHGHRDAGLAAGTATGLSAGALASHHDNDRHQHSTVPEATDQHSNTVFGARESQPGLGHDANQAYGTQGHNPTDPNAYQHEGCHRGTGLATGAAAGLGAGALASHGHGGENKHAAPESSTQYSRAGHDTTHGYSAQSSQPTDSLTRDPTQQPHRSEDSHRGGGLATGAAAGLGAGALASRGHHGQQDRAGYDNYGTQSTQPSATTLESPQTHGTQSAQPTDAFTRGPQRSDTHRGTGLGAATAAGLGAGAIASHVQHRDDQEHTRDTSLGYQPESTIPSTTANTSRDTHKSEPFTDRRTSSDLNPPTITQKANEGQYNTLASGTPSGIRIDDGVKTIRPAQREPVESKDKHHGTGVAGLGAAAAGAGTAAYLSRDKDEKKTEQPDAETKGPATRDFAATTGISSSSQMPKVRRGE